jgi:hypothetical protein
MKDKFDPWHADSSRLKQVNIELGHLASKHKTCRLNSAVFSGLGAVILAISLLGLVQLLPAGAGDWAQNQDSPVYALAAKQQSIFLLKGILVAIGFVAGLALLFSARVQCSRQVRLWQREGELRQEMRRIRDKLYIADQLGAVHEAHAKHPAAHKNPLDPAEARGEYVGVYNPPASRRDHRLESA